ncbi:MAG TPA: 30S ribosomal protein S6 [Ruminococcaceae bacterium]|nr:30S ribosomal protein S6 [Oscillospiraceae bacterium]
MADIKNSYETVFILSMKLGDEGIETLSEKFKGLIEANAEIENIDKWGKRRLAYPINKEEEGYYTLISFKSAPSFIAELERVYKITDGVLRYLTVKKEQPKKVKPKKVKAVPAADDKKEE